MKRIIAVIITIALLLCSCALNENANKEKTNNEPVNRNDEKPFVSAVWLSYNEIAALSDGRTEREFRDETINLAGNLLSFGINTLIVHAVAFCDSYYKSEFLPKSKRLDSKKNYDIFGIICELCSTAGIEVQAWINPYRVSNTGDFSAVKENPAVKKIYSEDKNNLIINENEIYLNPASSMTQKLVLDEARELIKNYDISAIHIDDYFYPDMSSFTDKKSFENYRKSGGSLSVDNWRRENLNTLICSLHSLVDSYGKKLAISPAASIEKNYSSKYADISLWLENGWADYIIPQIYFGFENETMPFKKVLDEWIEITKDKPTELIIGLAAYKCGQVDFNAGSGKNEWIENGDVLSRQLSLILRKNTIYGVAFFSYSHIFDKNIKKFTKKQLQNIKSML